MHQEEATMRIYLTSLARASAVRVGNSARFAPEVGPGPVLGILRRPPAWAAALITGHVLGLMPKRAELDAVQGGSLPFAGYCDMLRRRWAAPMASGLYAPGALRVAVASDQHTAQHHPEGAFWDGQWWEGRDPVADGSTLCCACKDAPVCHRSVAAEVLAAAGWDVILDGKPVAPPSGSDHNGSVGASAADRGRE